MIDRSFTILMADDDADDRLLARDALAASPLATGLHFVSDGEELLQYLRREPPFDAPRAAPRPDLILLDLNMPRRDGREALAEVKRDAELRSIPVVVLTTSSTPEDVLGCYRLGAASFITKPVTFSGLVNVMRALGSYWMDTVSLPHAG